MKYLIGVDCGSTVVKAALFDEQGQEKAVAVSKVDHFYPHRGWVENDAEQLWRLVLNALERLVRESRVDPGRIAVIGCTGYGNGLYLTDEQGHPTRPGIISSDSRAREFVERWQRDGTVARIRPKTLQTTWPGQPNALLRFLLREEPETIARSKWYFTCKDYIRFRLTGRPLWEISDATGSSLLNGVTGDYDEDVLAAWGLESVRSLFPPLCRSLDLGGAVTPEVAQKTGLLAGTPVAAGMFDIDACSLAVGMTDPDYVCMVAGTWGNNLSIMKNPPPDNDLFMISRYALEGYYLLLEGSPTSASNFEWFVTRFLNTEEVGDRNACFAQCLEQVAKTEPDVHGPVFLPYLFGSPVSLDARGTLFGLEGRHGQGDVLRAVLEGTVFGHRWHMDRLERFRPAPQCIRLTGGATRSPLWSQLFADIFQTRVEIPDGTELGVLGAAMGGSLALGLKSSVADAVATFVRINRVYEPDPSRADLYHQKYQRFLRLLDLFRDNWTLEKTNSGETNSGETNSGKAGDAGRDD